MFNELNPPKLLPRPYKHLLTDTLPAFEEGGSSLCVLILHPSTTGKNLFFLATSIIPRQTWPRAPFGLINTSIPERPHCHGPLGLSYAPAVSPR